MNKRLATTTAGEFVEVEVYYDKGGWNLGAMMGFSDGPEKRGYWLAVRRVTVKTYTNSDGTTWSSTQFALGDGLKVFLLEVKRKSPKAEAEANRLAAGREQEVVTAYLQKKGLELAKEVA